MGMSSKKLFRWYKDVLSGYKSPAHQRHLQKTRASRSLGSSAKSPVSPDLKIPILNEKNMGSTICIDEKNINGDCYTIVSNPETNKIVLMVNTLRASQIVYLMRSNISQEALFAVSCVTRDMAPNYDWVARELFPNAYQVADKFHVVKNIIDQVQSVRIRYRQELLRKQRELDEASRKRPKLLPDPKIQQELKDLKKELTNGDTLLQLLQRSKGLLHKLPNEHSASQKLRAQLLFRLFPDIKEAYKFSVALRKWDQHPMRNGSSITPSRHLLERKKKTLIEIITRHLSSPCEEVKNIAHFMVKHIGEICNYFLGYKTNASAEALNQNLQRFIAINYGARNRDFFLYRIAVHFS